ASARSWGRRGDRRGDGARLLRSGRGPARRRVGLAHVCAVVATYLRVFASCGTERGRAAGRRCLSPCLASFSCSAQIRSRGGCFLFRQRGGGEGGRGGASCALWGRGGRQGRR